MTPKTYLDLLSNSNNIPSFLADFHTFAIVNMNQSMVNMLGGEEEFLGKPFYQVIKNEIIFENQVLEQIIPNFCWEEEPLHRNRIYDSRLNLMIDAQVFPLEVDGTPYLWGLLEPLNQEEEDNFNLEQGMAQSLAIIQSGQEVLPSFLKLLASYYQSERCYIYRLDQEQGEIHLSHQWHCVDQLEITQDISSKMPVQAVFSWLDTRNEMGILECNKQHQGIQADSFEMKLLQTFSLENVVFSTIEDSKGKIIAALGIGNRRNLKMDFCFLQAVSEFVKQEITKETITNIEKINYVDLLTGFYRRPYYNLRIESLDMTAPQTLGVVFANVNGLKSINCVNR